MTTPNSTPQPSRRTVLKAASAAGIVWATPVLHSSVVHAASTCVSVQFNSVPTAEVTTDPANDGSGAGCTTIPACGLSGTGSLCTCSSFTIGAPVPASPGTITLGGTLYTAPAGCTIVAANARISNPTGSGCLQQWPCGTATIAADNKTASFPSLTFPAIYWKYRIILCCTT